MLNKIKIYIVGMMTIAGLATATAAPVGAVDLFNTCDSSNSSTKVCKAENKDDAQDVIKSIISLLLWIVGAVSVLMIIIGGIKYVVSNGDSQRIQSAKNTIMYAVIGVIVALVGQAVIIFVVGELTT